MPPSTSIVKLETQIQHYAWGSHSAIAEIQGRATPTDSPEAELWIGDHPHGPSRVVEASGTTPLDEWCKARGADALGAGRDRLPYLVKILAAAEPLSIQLHPNAQQAAEGYAREQAAGIALGDPQRSYSDPNVKVEALCALGPFEALCGLKPGDEVRRLVAKSRSSVAGELLAEAGEDSSDEELAGALFRLLLKLSSPDSERARRLVKEITRYGEREQQDSAEVMWIGKLTPSHPGDCMLIAPLLLNHVVLERGQALEVAPNTPHFYLSGTGVEIMTSSDNVVRGGLTGKHVAQDEFARLLDGRATAPRICEAPADGKRTLVPYPLETDEFRISRVTARRGEANESIATGAGQPRILLCVKGELELRDAKATSSVSLSSGEAALVPACVGVFELMGDAEGFLVEPG